MTISNLDPMWNKGEYGEAIEMLRLTKINMENKLMRWGTRKDLLEKINVMLGGIPKKLETESYTLSQKEAKFLDAMKYGGGLWKPDIRT
jgi:hypothetical protein